MKDFDAKTYKDSKGGFNNEDENLLILLLSENEDKKTILDVGCGDGLLTQKIKNNFPGSDIVGIDNSVEQIDMAKSSGASVVFEVADISEYRPDKKFDAVYSFYAFPHMPKSKISKALANVKSLLKEGGKFYLFTNICLFDTSIATPEDQEACDVVFLENWPSQINLTSVEEMRELLKINSLSIVSEKRLQTGAKVKDYGDMVSWLFILN